LSQLKDTEYLRISSRVRAMENRLMTRERLERMIDARDNGEALKILSECGYPELSSLSVGELERALSAGRTDTFRDLAGAVPDRRLVELFQLKYDYHNAKVLVKSSVSGQQPNRLLIRGGRCEPETLLEGWERKDFSAFAPAYAQALTRAALCLKESGDPQQADVLLDRACYEEMALLAKGLESAFLQDYVRLAVDAANLRSCVRCARLEKGAQFLAGVLLEGGSVPVDVLTRARGQDIAACFKSGPLQRAAEMGAKLAQPGGPPLTAFERECDNALQGYLAQCRRCPFGEQVVVGYLYAKEAELTAIRTVMAGRLAGLEGDVIRQRLRQTYI